MLLTVSLLTVASVSASHLAEDRFEPNDSFDTATPVSPGTYSDLTVVHGESDYYRIELDQGDQLNATILFDHSDGDLDFYVLDPDRNFVEGSFSVTDNENIVITAQKTGTYYVIVYGFDGASAPYTLQVNPSQSEITVDLDIKPGGDTNAINPRSNGVIPVAILGTEEFDPTTELDVSTLRFGAPDAVDNGGGAQPAHGGHVEDVNDDGIDDLVLHFPTRESGFDRDDTDGKLVGETTDGLAVVGTDSVRIVG